jgi:hypothetical protein
VHRRTAKSPAARQRDFSARQRPFAARQRVAHGKVADKLTSWSRVRPDQIERTPSSSSLPRERRHLHRFPPPTRAPPPQSAAPPSSGPLPPASPLSSLAPPPVARPRERPPHPAPSSHIHHQGAAARHCRRKPELETCCCCSPPPPPRLSVLLLAPPPAARAAATLPLPRPRYASLPPPLSPISFAAETTWIDEC